MKRDKVTAINNLLIVSLVFFMINYYDFFNTISIFWIQEWRVELDPTNFDAEPRPPPASERPVTTTIHFARKNFL